MSALTEYCSAVQDKQNLDLVQKVIQAFKDEVTPKYSQLNEGYLHGDMNEQNILVKEIADTKTDDKQCCDVTAFIDWGHMTYSYRIFDIAIMIAYLSIQSKEINQLDVGGHILAGYLTERTLNHDEMDVLKMCICARLAQSLVIGAYAHQKTPSNAYAITTAESGWPLLRKYWQTSKSELLHRWNRILNAYKANT